jgi:hypothetical protein
MSRFAVVVVAALASLPAVAQGADPLLQSLSGQQPKAFLEPEGFYMAVIPAGFDCDVRKRNVECRGNRGHAALLVMRVEDVPPSATPEIKLLNEMDRFKKKPHFKLVAKQRTIIDGSPAITTSFSYDYLGNVEYQVGVQALYMIRSGKLYVLHFESRLDQFPSYAGDLAKLYASFKPAQLDAAGHPVLEDLPAARMDPAATPDGDSAEKHGF